MRKSQLCDGNLHKLLLSYSKQHNALRKTIHLCGSVAGVIILKTGNMEWQINIFDLKKGAQDLLISYKLNKYLTHWHLIVITKLKDGLAVWIALNHAQLLHNVSCFSWARLSLQVLAGVGCAGTVPGSPSYIMYLFRAQYNNCNTSKLFCHMNSPPANIIKHWAKWSSCAL